MIAKALEGTNKFAWSAYASKYVPSHPTSNWSQIHQQRNQICHININKNENDILSSSVDCYRA